MITNISLEMVVTDVLHKILKCDILHLSSLPKIMRNVTTVKML